MEWKIGEIREVNGEWYQCIESDSCGECSLRMTECGSGTKSNLADEVFGECSKIRRSDSKHVIFKKLEKVGEPFVSGGKLYQHYKVFDIDNIDFNKCTNANVHNYNKKILTVEIKQNQEEIEEKKNNLIEELDNLFRKHNIYISYSVCESMACEIGTWFAPQNNEENSNSESIEKNLKPFNLDAAKQGKPVCTRDGCKARIICFDRKDNTPIVALIERVDGIEILQCFYNDGKCFHDQLQITTL